EVKQTPENELKYILILAAVQFAHMVDFVVLMPLGPTLMKSLDINPVQFGSLVSSYNFSAAGAGILFGAFADRFDRKSLMMVVLTGFLVGTFLCGMATTYTPLLLFRIFTGAFGGMLNGVIFAIISDIIPVERRGRAMGIVMSSFSVASVLGVPIGLAISDYFGWNSTFIFIASFTCVIWIMAQIVFPNLNDHVGKVKPQFFLQLKSLFRNRDYVRCFVFIFFVSGSMFLLIPYLSPYAVKNMGIETTQLKFMYLVGGLFTIITARIVGVFTDRVGAINMFLTVLAISFVPILLYTHSGPIRFVAYLALGTFFMTTVSGRMIPCMTMVSEVPDEGERGLFMSVLNSIRSTGSASMTFLAGFIITEAPTGELIGFDRTGYLAITLGLFTAVLAFKINKSLAFSRLKRSVA
ncbi:MAG: MFS transporter, partial [Halobacteriovoraceae bacterium]|nr:MFS transporter [Halobacteriovoraceae bacterium]